MIFVMNFLSNPLLFSDYFVEIHVILAGNVAKEIFQPHDLCHRHKLDIVYCRLWIMYCESEPQE